MISKMKLALVSAVAFTTMSASGALAATFDFKDPNIDQPAADNI